MKYYGSSQNTKVPLPIKGNFGTCAEMKRKFPSYQFKKTVFQIDEINAESSFSVYPTFIIGTFVGILAGPFGVFIGGLLGGIYGQYLVCREYKNVYRFNHSSSKLFEG